MKPYVLWVEDSARFELASVLGPFFASRRYDLTLAEDATVATSHLQNQRYDVVISDIRLPPGNHAYWRRLYGDAGADRTNAKLGLKLLAWLFNGEGSGEIQRPKGPLRADQVGVLSVESQFEIGEQLASYGVRVIREKRPGLPDTILLDLVDEVLAQGHGV